MEVSNPVVEAKLVEVAKLLEEAKPEAEVAEEVEAVAILAEVAAEVEVVVAEVEAAVPVDQEEAVAIPVDLVLYLETVSTKSTSKKLL